MYTYLYIKTQHLNRPISNPKSKKDKENLYPRYLYVNTAYKIMALLLFFTVLFHLLKVDWLIGQLFGICKPSYTSFSCYKISLLPQRGPFTRGQNIVFEISLVYSQAYILSEKQKEQHNEGTFPRSWALSSSWHSRRKSAPTQHPSP